MPSLLGFEVSDTETTLTLFEGILLFHSSGNNNICMLILLLSLFLTYEMETIHRGPMLQKKLKGIKKIILVSCPRLLCDRRSGDIAAKWKAF